MLEVKNIYKTFNVGTANEKHALNGVELTMEDGDFITVIGGNGAGKSTLMNAIAGAWPVDEGSIIIDGVDVTKLSEHKRAAFIGRVFQDPMMGTAATMGIEENLALLMATLIRPKLLLDEHTAMITHNMRDAIVHGNRLIMMHEGRVILDIRGEEKKRLTVEDLMHEFEKASGEIFASDKALLG